MNEDRIAVPLAGPGGKLAIFETKRPGRIEAGVLPVIINGATVLDFAFDPFDKLFGFFKSLLTIPSNVLPLLIKQFFRP